MCSAVWNAFTKSECGARATCDICFKGYSNSGNTTNLWNHLSSTRTICVSINYTKPEEYLWMLRMLRLHFNHRKYFEQ